MSYPKLRPASVRRRPIPWAEYRIRSADRIRELRNRHGLTHVTFAREIGYNSHSTVGQWEAGKGFPGAKALLGMARRFGVGVEWLLGVPDAAMSPDRLVVWGDGGKHDALESELDAPLRAALRKAVKERIDRGDALAALIYRDKRRNDGIEAILPPGPLLPLAIEALVAVVENQALLLWKLFTPIRVARAVGDRCDARDIEAAKLGAQLALAELEIVDSLRKHARPALGTGTRVAPIDALAAARTTERQSRRLAWMMFRRARSAKAKPQADRK